MLRVLRALSVTTVSTACNRANTHCNKCLTARSWKIIFRVWVCRGGSPALPFPCSRSHTATHVHHGRHSGLPAHLLWAARSGPCDRRMGEGPAPTWGAPALLLLPLHDCSWRAACGSWWVSHPWSRSVASQNLLLVESVDTRQTHQVAISLGKASTAP